MIRRLTSILIGGLILGSAQAAMVWQPLAKPLPPEAAHASHGAPQHGQREGGGKPFRLLEGAGAEVQLWAPNLEQYPIKLEGSRAKVAGRGMDNYHALVAMREQSNLTEAAVRYVYMHGKPSGESPSKVVNADKLALEIMPDPLPREHWRYYSNDLSRFVIKWQGAPIMNSEVVLTTANGTEETLYSDVDGIVEFKLPDDFARVMPGRNSNPPAEFIIIATHQQGEHHYQTTFSADYHVDPVHWQSNQLALWMVGAGFIAGLGVVRLGRKGEKA